MNDEVISTFFAKHKQPVENSGFTERLFSQLEYLPKPEPRVSRSELIVLGFSLVGLVLFVLLGGYDVFFKGLASMGSLLSGRHPVTPEVLVPIFFMVGALYALGRYAVQEE